MNNLNIIDNILLVCSSDGTNEIWVFALKKMWWLSINLLWLIYLITSESIEISPSDGVDKCFVGNFSLFVNKFWPIDFSLVESKFCWEIFVFQGSCECVDILSDDIDGNRIDGVKTDFKTMVFSSSSI